jgi:hypothetical protein
MRFDEPGCLIVALSGQLQAEHVGHIGALLENEPRRIALDLQELFLADREAVQFLAACETKGHELRNCPAFVRQWIRWERP